MSIGITQLILIVVIGIILFGNIPKLFKDIGTGVMAFKSTISNETPKDNLSDKDTKGLPSNSEKPCDSVSSERDKTKRGE